MLSNLVDAVPCLLAAVVAGAALGWEREAQDKPAGLRTHTMVSLGCALLTVVALRFMHDARMEYNQVVDPFRVLQGIVGGIGFLGAGAIIQSSGSVSGLTTASNIWLSAAAGITCGMGYFELAAFAVILGLGILLGFVHLERVVNSRHAAEARARRLKRKSAGNVDPPTAGRSEPE